jgi:hypothetical protein
MKIPTAPIETFIHSVRGEKIIFAADLANIYGVSTRVLNQAVKRNRNRFPSDFCFQLSEPEWKDLRSQIVISNYGSRIRPWAFTEHGAVMAANVLKSEKAVQLSIFVVRAFMKMRQALGESSTLATRLDKLEKEITSRLDSHEKAIVELMQQFLSILNPDHEGAEAAPKREIGFHVKDKKEDGESKSRRAR